MRDVTDVFDRYRIAAREIWNSAFWPDAELRDGESLDAFHNIEQLLFDAIVLRKADVEFNTPELFLKPLPFFHVEPKSEAVPIMIQNPRGPGQAGYWDHPVNQVRSGEATMHFVDYFDWAEMEYVDFRFYRVRIAKFDKHPELVGREALLDWQFARVMLDES
jgi:hypothetical protein